MCLFAFKICLYISLNHVSNITLRAFIFGRSSAFCFWCRLVRATAFLFFAVRTLDYWQIYFEYCCLITSFNVKTLDWWVSNLLKYCNHILWSCIANVIFPILSFTYKFQLVVMRLWKSRLFQKRTVFSKETGHVYRHL